MDFAFIGVAWTARWAILSGLGISVLVSALAIVAGSFVGVFVGLGLTFGARPVRWLARLYTDFVRGTPVLVLVLSSYYILGTVGVHLDALQAGVLALAVFCSSHIGEIVRGALQAIPRGQTEAAKATGLTFSQTFIYVLMPQAARQALPSCVNVAAEIVKASTLLSIIGVGELLLTTQQIIARSFMGLPFYLFAGFLYFLVNFGIERLGKYVERRLAISAS